MPDLSFDLAQRLPQPGRGRTPERFRALWMLASRSPSIGRLAEAHHDALAILTESGRVHPAAGLHAVWAAGGPDPLRVVRRDGDLRLKGTKHWCSGATLASRALVTAVDDVDGDPARGSALVLVDMCSAGVRVNAPDWASPAFTTVETRSVSFDTIIEPGAIIGVDDWYLRRPGFWHGAIGVAACWAGAMAGIIDRLRPCWRDEPHAMAHLGAIDAQIWSLRAALDAAAGEIDDEPIGSEVERRRRALRVRHIADVALADIGARVARALGPGPLAHVAGLHVELAEVDLYRRQCHAERDLEVLGRLVSASDSVSASTSDAT